MQASGRTSLGAVSHLSLERRRANARSGPVRAAAPWRLWCLVTNHVILVSALAWRGHLWNVPHVSVACIVAGKLSTRPEGSPTVRAGAFGKASDNGYAFPTLVWCESSPRLLLCPSGSTRTPAVCPSALEYESEFLLASRLSVVNTDQEWHGL